MIWGWGMDWSLLMEVAVIGYFGISVVLEILEFIFLLTPTKGDDRFIDRVKGKWSLIRDYVFLLSVRTPLVMVLPLIQMSIKSINRWVKNRIR
jgi:hypothetical protein